MDRSFVHNRDIPPTHPGVMGPSSPVFRPNYPFVPDRDLTLFQDGLRWTFSEGKVCVDGQEVNRLLNERPVDASYWMGVAEGMSQYRKRVHKAIRDAEQFARFEAVVDALMGKILCRLKKMYDQKMSGLSWTLEDGQLVLNGINIRSFLALYRLRKTEKARKFLKGLRSRLAVLLENRQESPDYERIREMVSEIFGEVQAELAFEEASSAGYYLSSPSASAG